MDKLPTNAQAFLGEVATWTGIVTGTLMFASPALFARWKWRGVAGATPAFMLWTGLPFFLGCVMFNLAKLPTGVGSVALRALVIVGAILQVGAGSRAHACTPCQRLLLVQALTGLCCRLHVISKCRLPVISRLVRFVDGP